MSKIIASEKLSPSVSGKAGLWKINEDGIIVPVTFTPNQIQYAWGYIAAQTIGGGLASYAIRQMYIEFENVAAPADPVTVPSYGRDEGTEYYDDLSSSGTRDFLRVPMIQAPLLGVESGQESLFGDNEGNKLTFFAQTASGMSGVHGKTFSNGANSKVFGAALVAAPVPSDRSRDLVFARTYFDVADQTVKEVSSQIGVTWELTFKVEP